MIPNAKRRLREPQEFMCGPSVIIPISFAAWLNERFDLDHLRPRILGSNPEVDCLLAAIVIAAKSWRLSDAGNIARPLSEPARESISTGRAAGLIGITDRAIRAAIDRHDIPATKIDGRWQINRTDVETYRINRKAA